jgi:protein TonB
MGFIFYMGKSVATVPASSNDKAMHFNLLTISEPNKTYKEPLIPSLNEVKLAAMNSVVKAHLPTKQVIKKELVKLKEEKTKTIVHPKEKVLESKLVSVPVKTSANPIVKSRVQERPNKSISVTRQVDNIIVQPARFKTLPPPPNYPRRARLRGQQGVALVHAKLNAAGEVTKTRLAKSSGFNLLDKAAIKAVYQWDFTPGSTSQSNVQVWVEIPVKFILNPIKVS